MAPHTDMRSIRRTVRLVGRAIVLARAVFSLPVAITALACTQPLLLPYTRGVPQFESLNLIPVPGGAVNAAGGNLILRRSDFSVDTIMGEHALRATYESMAGEWLWSFQVSYDGGSFRDETGATFDLSGLADGERVPGTFWTRSDASAVRTRGGREYVFDTGGRLAHVKWHTLDYPRIRYTWSSGLLDLDQCTAVDVCTGLYSVALDASDRPLLVVGLRAGRRMELDYDAQGRLVEVRDPLAVAGRGPGTRYEYEQGGPLVTASVSPAGERVEYAYAPGQRIWTVTRVGEGNPTDTFGYAWLDVNGWFPFHHTNPLGGETTYSLDASRRLVRVERFPKNEVTSYAWSGLRPVRRTDPSGAVTDWVYDDDELVTTLEPSGNVVQTVYEPGALNFDDPTAAPIRRVEDSVGVVEERLYDSDGRVVSLANGTGDTTTLRYHFGQTVASRTDPFGISHAYPLYGTHGHWLEVSEPSADHRVFDPVGNPVIASTVLERGGILSRSWNENRQLVALELGATNEMGEVTSIDDVEIERDAVGRLVAIRRPGGADHELDRDALGRVAVRREWVGGTWQSTAFEYDAADNVTAVELPNGMRRERETDAFGRLARIRILRYGALEGEAEFTYGAGLLATYTDSVRNLTETFAYDAAGRLASVTIGGLDTISNAYDLRSRLTRETFSVAGLGIVAAIDRAYDLANREIGITDASSGEPLVSRGYMDGKLASVSTGNGLARAHFYDADSGERIGFETRDAVGNLVETTTVSNTLENGPDRSQLRAVTTTPLATTEEQYWMGVGGSLASADSIVGKRVFGWSDGNGVVEYAYDALGNRLTSSTAGTYQYDTERARLLSAVIAGQSIAYTWDSAGYATSRRGVPITWTADGRLASHGADTLSWDLLGQLVRATVGGVDRDWTRFGGRIESHPTLGTLASLDLGEVAVAVSGSGRRYRHRDFRGNVGFVSDEAGSVRTHFHYAPFEVVAVHGETGQQPGFVSRRSFGELAILGARIYDPPVGRFLSPDPVFQLVNNFAYTLGNPVWFADPDGTEAEGGEGGIIFANSQQEAAIALELALIAILAPQSAGAIAAYFATLHFVNEMSKGQAGVGEISDGSGGGGGAGCAPTRLAEVPAPSWLFALLFPVQIALGALWLRFRSHSREEDSRD